MKKERYLYLDYSKAIGILLIIFAHVAQYFPPMKAVCFYVCSFHVPVFFVCGGALQFYRSEKEINIGVFLKKRILTLIVPYVIFSLINSALKFGILFLQNGLSDAVIKEELIQLFITGNGTVWFCVTYFFVELIFCLVKKIKHFEIVSAILACLSMVAAFAFKWNINPIGIVTVRILAGFAFYTFGYFVIKIFDINKLNLLPSIVFAVLFLIAVAVIYLNFGNGYAFFEGSFKKPAVSLSSAIFGALAIMLVANALSNLNLWKWSGMILKYLGQNSLIVMLVHPTILLLFTYPLRNLMINSSGIMGLLGGVGVFLAVVLLDIPCIYIINRWFPWIIGKERIKMYG